MTQALELAKLGRHSVSPNPMVGCVITKDNRVIGSGYHKQAGGPHAEVFALQQAGESAKNATLYVTLEPCAHYGRTPPCVDAIIRAGVIKVVVACLDPNPLVGGKGVRLLCEAGIEVEVGVCEAEAKELNEIFFHYIKTKRPFVISKWAMSLDGKTVTHPEDNRQISSAESQMHCHQTRAAVDAILIGSRTLLSDDPLLTVRMIEDVSKQPVRIIVSNQAYLPASLKVFDPNLEGRTIVVTPNRQLDNSIHRDNVSSSTNQSSTTSLERYTHLPSHVEILTIDSDGQGNIDLASLLDELGKRHITSVLVEGGMTLHQQFFAKNLVNKTIVYLAPVVIGSSPNKITLKEISMKGLGKDICIESVLEGE